VSEFLFPEEPIRFSSESLDKMLLHCVNLSASDVTLQTNTPVLAEIHGRLYPITQRRLSNTEVGDMLNAIYGSNGTTQIFSGKDVDTQYEVRPNRSQRFRFRVNGTGCQVEGHDGLQITLRSIPSSPPDLTSLELEPAIIEAMAPEQGTVIVTGPTGSGKSTLLAAIIRYLAEQADGHRKMLTYESPIEFVYDMVNMPSSLISQSEIPRHLPSFAAGVRNALRRKPRLILVGEARDAETMSAVIDAALTGHPCYTTLHSNGVSDAVRRMISTFSAEERHGRALDILETLRLVVWQRLAASTDGKRVALREYLVFDQEVRDILIKTPVELLASKTRQLLRERGQPMCIDAKRKFEKGLLSERDYKIIETRSQMADKDAGLNS
jgi:defect-in-organelle-trafficking protein DotB